MRKKSFIRLMFLFVNLVMLFVGVSCKESKDKVLTIRTNMGSIKVKLYDETILHKENFLRLAQEGYYENILFHRVIKDFVIQAGDPASKGAPLEILLGDGDVGYVIEQEIRPEYFHKKGVLAAAREADNINPDRNSSGGHFYIAVGKRYTDAGLDSAVWAINEKRQYAIYNLLRKKYEPEISKLSALQDFKGIEEITKKISLESREILENDKLVLTPEQRNAYINVGGIPHLDGHYTVFGEVVEGMDVVEKIVQVETDEYDRPLRNVVILKVE